MTDRFKSLLVSLDKDIREDDAESLLNAIRMLKGVLHVQGNISDALEDSTIAMRERHRLEKKLWEAIRND